MHIRILISFIDDKWKLIKYLINKYNEMQLNYLK